jgi:hypothetical protein
VAQEPDTSRSQVSLDAQSSLKGTDQTQSLSKQLSKPLSLQGVKEEAAKLQGDVTSVDAQTNLSQSNDTAGESALHTAGPKTQSEILEAAKAKPLNRQAELHFRNPNNHFVRSPDGMLHVFRDKESALRFHAAAEAIK